MLSAPACTVALSILRAFASVTFRHTNPFVVLRVGNEIRGGNVLFETVNPDWNYQINFMEVVSLSSEIEVRCGRAGAVLRLQGAEWCLLDLVD